MTVVRILKNTELLSVYIPNFYLLRYDRLSDL